MSIRKKGLQFRKYCAGLKRDYFLQANAAPYNKNPLLLIVLCIICLYLQENAIKVTI